MRKFLPMLPYVILAVVFLGGGIYQIVSGKESFMMSGYRKKYNYERNRKKFIRMCGVMDAVGAVFLGMLLPWLYVRGDMKELLLVSLLFLCALGVGQRLLLRRYTDNLEKRKY